MVNCVCDSKQMTQIHSERLENCQVESQFERTNKTHSDDSEQLKFVEFKRIVKIQKNSK